MDRTSVYYAKALGSYIQRVRVALRQGFSGVSSHSAFVKLLPRYLVC
jgi:hypothetical protein